MAFDLKVIETGTGGDVVNLGNDLAVTKSVQTMIYLCLFGGNVDGEFWANKLLMKSFPSQQFISLTEKTLNTTALDSAGRVIIENAVIEDLKFLNTIFTIFVKVKLPNIDHVTIEITLTKIDSAQEANLIINLKKTSVGDFSIYDFDFNDFLI